MMNSISRNKRRSPHACRSASLDDLAVLAQNLEDRP